jgi:hypothetical protein
VPVKKTHDYVHYYRGYWSDGGQCDPTDRSGSIPITWPCSGFEIDYRYRAPRSTHCLAAVLYIHLPHWLLRLVCAGVSKWRSGRSQRNSPGAPPYHRSPS